MEVKFSMSDKTILITEDDALQPMVRPPSGMLTFNMKPSSKTEQIKMGGKVTYNGSCYEVREKHVRNPQRLQIL